MKLVITNDSRYAVLSDRNNVLGIFTTKESAENFLRSYTNSKKYSFDQARVGGQEALKLFRQRQKIK